MDRLPVSDITNTMSVADFSHIQPAIRVADEDDNPFDDFDGVHCTQNDAVFKRKSILQTMRTSPAHNSDAPISPTRTDLVYYPAPVPVMLTLPPKLSSGFKAVKLVANNNRQCIPFTSTVHSNGYVQKNDESPAGFAKSSVSIPCVSTLFDDILDATVAAPVLSIIKSASVTIAATSRQPHSTEKLPKDVDNLVLTDSDGLFPSTPRRDDIRFFSATQGHSSSSGSLLNKHLDIVGHRNDSAIESAVDSVVNDGLRTAAQYPHSDSSNEAHDIQFAPATLLAELEARKTQQRARTHKTKRLGPSNHQSTLLERDALAEVQKEARRRGPVTLAWQNDQNLGDDVEDDVPLGLLFASKLSSRPEDSIRMPGLLAMREAEDNEPLRKRQARLKSQYGKETTNVHSSDNMDESETLGQRRQRLRAEQQTSRTPKDSTQADITTFSSSQNPLTSMPSILQVNAQKQTYGSQLPLQVNRDLLAPELPFGYQAQQQLHVSLLNAQRGSKYAINSGTTLYPPYPFDHAMQYHPNMEVQYGLPFIPTNFNTEYLQRQQALLADQIEKWRSSVW